MLTEVPSGSNLSFILASVLHNRSKENRALSPQHGQSLCADGTVWHPVKDKCASQRPGRQRHHGKHTAAPANLKPDADICGRLR